MTLILFGTLSEGFKKIVRIVFELCALVWDGNDGDVVPKKEFLSSANISISSNISFIQKGTLQRTSKYSYSYT